MATSLGFDHYQSQVLPEDKANFVEAEQEAGRSVIMIGDGINDSVALSTSDVGISMHEGADLAKQIADIAIKTDDLSVLVTGIKLARALEDRIDATYREIIGFNSILIVLGALGVISPITSSFLHNGSTVLRAGRNMTQLELN